MRLNERMVRALEADDYSVFPSATFVSGYLRSYARIVGLAEEDVVRPGSDAIEPPSIVSTIGSKAQVSSSDLPVRMVTWLLVIVVIVSVSMWWFSQREKGQGILPVSNEEVISSDGKISLTLPEKTDTVTDAQSLPDSGTGTASPVEEPAPATEAPAVEKGPEPVNDNHSAAATEQGASDSTEDVADNKPSPPPLTLSTPTSNLELQYQADSWTEVTDAAGRQLVYGLIKAGQDLQVRGEAPFKVFLGYAPGVVVYYNNDLFDHSPFQRRDVARFRVGRAEHNLPGSR